MTLTQQIINTLKSHQGTPEKQKILMGFFKTGPGEYGEGDQFLGIPVPTTRAIAKTFVLVDLNTIHQLLLNEWHEVRLCALLMLITRFKKLKNEQELIVKFYVDHARYINNWDLVDLSAPHIVGAYLLTSNDRSLLYELAESDMLWKRRIAMVSTLTFIRHDQFQDTLALSKMLLNDKESLMHKATGWMLREVGKRDEPVLTAFLESYARELPRTALRYAIEHYPEEERKEWLKNSKS
ncbi:MAG: DNA alkylation repair protein [Bacteroidaceae bacterium]|nr:DNA alkylation repair protein [Bacteroidaceae bacterium]